MRVSRSVFVGSVLVTGLALVVLVLVVVATERDAAPDAPRGIAAAAVSGAAVAPGSRRPLEAETATEREALGGAASTRDGHGPRLSAREAVGGGTDAPGELGEAVERVVPDAPHHDVPRLLKPRRVQKISAVHGDFPATLVAGGKFGRAIASVDGVPGLLAVGAPHDDSEQNPSQIGLLWLVFLDEEGIARETRRIEVANGPFAVAAFARAGEATRELALGCHWGSTVQLLRFDEAWEVRERESLQQGDGILPPSRSVSGGGFGASLAGWWTDEAEPRAQLAVGVPSEARYGSTGDGYVAFLERWRGPFRLLRWLGPGAPGMPEDDGQLDRFGKGAGSVVVGGDRVLAVGSWDSTSILTLDEIGQITRHVEWDEGRVPSRWLGELAVRAVGSSRLQIARGFDPAYRSEEVWLTTGFPDRPPQTVRRSAHPKGERTERWGDGFGLALAWLDDLDGSGLPELAVGAPFDDDGGEDTGALWILFF